MAENQERQDSLSRFAPISRRRVQVPPRTDDMPVSPAIVPKHTDTYESGHIDDNVLKKEVEPEVKRSSFRMDAAVLDALHDLARKNGISREVLIESMFEHLRNRPEELAQVIEQAQGRHRLRQEWANRKRAQSMMDKFGS